MSGLGEFVAWPKTPRLNKTAVTITEKLDGSNGCISFERTSLIGGPKGDDNVLALAPTADQGWLAMRVQSRKRFLGDGKANDNFGFAAWAVENAEQLAVILGEGRHYGEWYGRGIQRGYGLEDRRFALFSPWRYQHVPFQNEGLALELVPTLETTTLDHLSMAISRQLEGLLHGSRVNEYPNPEGIVVNIMGVDKPFKYILDNPDTHKGALKACEPQGPPPMDLMAELEASINAALDGFVAKKQQEVMV